MTKFEKGDKVRITDDKGELRKLNIPTRLAGEVVELSGICSEVSPGDYYFRDSKGFRWIITEELMEIAKVDNWKMRMSA